MLKQPCTGFNIWVGWENVLKDRFPSYQLCTEVCGFELQTLGFLYLTSVAQVENVYLITQAKSFHKIY